MPPPTTGSPSRRPAGATAVLDRLPLGGRRARPRRRLRLRPGHRAAPRAAARRHGRRPGRLAVDDRRGAPAAGAVRRPGRVRGRRPRRAAAARAAGRRDPVDRHVPLGPRPRRRCSGTSRRSSDRAAGSSPSAAAPATSRRSSAVLATIGDGWLGPAHFATPEATRVRLAAAGFVDIETWLNPEPTTARARRAARDVPGDGGPARAPRAAAREADRAAFVHEVAERLPRPEIDYVRLNILATRAG